MRSRFGGAVVVIALGASAVACGRFGFDSTDNGEDPIEEPDVDAAVNNAEADAAPDPDAAGFIDPLGLFNPPAALPELVGLDAVDPTLRADLLEMFVVINGDISHVLRNAADEEFGGLREISEFNTPAVETTPRLSPEGRTMFFASARPGGLGDHDIYMSTRPVDRWGAPVAVTELSSDQFDAAPSSTLDLRTVVFVSNRNGGLDLYQSRRSDAAAAWEAPLPITTVNSSAVETDPFLSANGLELYFCSTRAGGLGGTDLYIAVRDSVDDPFGAPQALTELNSVSDDCGVWLSPDRREIWFTSDRGGTDAIYRADR